MAASSNHTVLHVIDLVCVLELLHQGSGTCWQSTIKIVAKQGMQSIGSKIVVQTICVHIVQLGACSKYIERSGASSN